MKRSEKLEWLLKTKIDWSIGDYPEVFVSSFINTPRLVHSLTGKQTVLPNHQQFLKERKI